MRLRTTILGITCAAFLILAAGAQAAVFTDNGSRNASPFTSGGPVFAEGPGGVGKYVWFVDHQAGEDVLRGYDQSNPLETAVLAQINGNDDVGEGPMGSITGVAFSPSQNLLFVADRTNNRLIVYPRSNDGTANDPINTASSFSVYTFNPGFGVTDPRGVAIDTHGGVYGYASITSSNNKRGLMVFSQTPSGNSLGWVKFVWDPSTWSDVNGPGALAVDQTNGNIYAAIDGRHEIRGYTAFIDGLAGTFTAPVESDYNSISVDRGSNRLFAARAESVDVFSLTSSRYLGSASGAGMDAQNIGFAQLTGTNKFFLAGSGSPYARDLLANAGPTCTPGPSIEVVEGETATFTPDCTDPDASTTQEFEIVVQPETGSASLSNNDGAIDFHAGANAAGFDDSISYRVTTQDGLSSTYSQSFTIIPPDETAPTVNITAPAAEATLYNSPATLRYTVNDNRDPAPSCSLSDEAQIPLDAGDNTITVFCTDASGNTGQDSVSFTYVPPDTEDPVVDITAPIDNSVQSAAAATLHYTASDNRDDLLDCDQVEGSEISLTEGPNTIAVSCEDDAGNIGTDSVTVDRDSTVPDVTITAPGSDAVVDTSSVTLEYVASDDSEETPTCNIDSGSAVDLDVGPNLITVECEDGAGNVGQASVSVTYDADAPVVEITAPVDGELVTTDAVTLNYSVSDDTDSEPSCSHDNGDAIALTPGDNTITVTCTDQAGHSGSASVTVTYDAAAPEVQIDMPADGATLTMNPALLHYTVTDDVDPEPECSAADGSDVQLIEGRNTITVTCTDVAGHIGTDSSTVTYAPPAQVGSLAVPEIRKSANLEPTGGQVLIKLPGSDQYIPLSEALLIPVGTIIDARSGTAHLTLANQDGTTYDAYFWGGIFQVFQGTGDQPIATMKLRDDLIDDNAGAASAFPAAGTNPFKTIRAARRGKKKNGLWGNGKGKFRTSGSGGSATVRGTKWYVANYEGGTLFKVNRGIVNVRPVHGDCFDLTAGQSQFVEFTPLTKSQREKKSKKKKPVKKGCF